MARPRTPDGRRVPVSFKLTEAEEAQADSLRGETGLNVFMRRMAVERMGELQDSGIPEHSGRNEVPVVKSRRRSPVGVARVPAAPPAAFLEPEARTSEQQTNCPHPKARIIKGLCRACGTYVGTGKGTT